MLVQRCELTAGLNEIAQKRRRSREMSRAGLPGTKGRASIAERRDTSRVTAALVAVTKNQVGVRINDVGLCSQNMLVEQRTARTRCHRTRGNGTA